MTKLLKRVEIEVKNSINSDPCRANLIMTQIWMQVNNLDHALQSSHLLLERIKDFLRKVDGMCFKSVVIATEWYKLEFKH